MATQSNKKQATTDKQPPKEALVFACPQPVEFLAAADGSAEGGFKITAYSGEVFYHPWWGNLAFDLSGMKFAAKTTPIFDTHDMSRRVGFSTDQGIKESVTLSGPFLDNAEAQSLRADMKKGFPMQASLGLSKIVVEQVDAGASTTVNGKVLKGPGAVFRKSSIHEVSMCAFGAAPNTESTALAADTNNAELEFLRKDEIMDKIEMTADRLKTEFAAVHDAVFASGREAGIKTERERMLELATACGEDRELFLDAAAKGTPLLDVLKARNEKLAAERAAILAAAQKVTPAVLDPARREFAADKPPQKPAEVFDEAKATDDQLKAHFAASKELQDQYTCADAYVASVRHPA